MDMMEQLSRIGIVPVIAINDAADAVPLAQALIDGGLPCAEVTFRTAAAADAISLLDGRRASREVTSYLHTEYHMARDYSPTLAQLRNL